jgi:hypothetical protein
MSPTGSLALDARLTHGHAHSVTTIVLIVIAIVAVIVLGVWLTRGPSAEELRLQRTAELLARLDGLTLFEVRTLFAQLANGTTEQQEWLEAALDAPDEA